MRIFILFIVVLASATNAQTQDIQTFINDLMQSGQIPELGYAVMSADSIFELQTVGFHRNDLKNKENQASIRDYFHLGSNTKAITGFVAAFLVESNAIKWTTPFFDLFSEWKNQSNSAYHEITLADLLSHRANIPPYTSGIEYQRLPNFEGEPSEKRKQFAKYVLTEAPVVLNSNVYHYSNAGYTIAALMLEEVSGKSWEQLTKDIMLSSLKVHVEFGWPNRIGPNQPYGHWIENDTLQALPPDINYTLELGEPAGDISMTLPDYATFIQLNLKGIVGKDTILKAETYHYLHYGLTDYSIGWSNKVTENHQFSEHSGSAGTFFCHTLIDKTNNVAYIIVANSATEQTQQGIFALLDRLRKKYVR